MTILIGLAALLFIFLNFDAFIKLLIALLQLALSLGVIGAILGTLVYIFAT